MPVEIDATTLTREQSVKLVDELIYTNYKYNRNRTPEFTPTQWKLVFGVAVDIMEKRYQGELEHATSKENQ